MKMTKEQLKTRADHARRLLNDELLNEMFDEIEADIFQSWKNSTVHDYDTRTDMFFLLKAVDALKTRLRATIDEGVLQTRS